MVIIFLGRHYSETYPNGFHGSITIAEMLCCSFDFCHSFNVQGNIYNLQGNVNYQFLGELGFLAMTLASFTAIKDPKT